MDYTPRYYQPFTLREAIALDVSVITEEISRLQNSLQKLRETQSILQEEQHDLDIKKAYEENEQVIGSQQERIAILKMALTEKGIVTGIHYDPQPTQQIIEPSVTTGTSEHGHGNRIITSEEVSIDKVPQMDQNELLGFRLQVINKLISLESLEKERRRRSQYQDTFIELGKSLSLESTPESTQLPCIDVNGDEFTCFTSLNKDVIDEIQNKMSLLLHSLSQQDLIRREQLDASHLLAQSQQVIETVKQIPQIHQTQTFRLKREDLEARVKALIRHSEALLSESNHNQTKNSMTSCLRNLKTILANVQKFPRYRMLDKQTVNTHDTKLESRLNHVRDSLLQLRGTHIKCVERLATIDDEVAEVLSLQAPLMAPLEEIIDSITGSTAMVKFYDENFKTELLATELQVRGSISSTQTDSLLPVNILIPLQDAISVFLSLHFGHDSDIEIETLNRIWRLDPIITEKDKE